MKNHQLKKNTTDVVETINITKLVGGCSSTVNDFNENDYLGHDRILSILSKEIYNTSYTTKTTIELWNALEKNFGTEDVGLKRFSVEKYLDFQMVDDKSLMDQVHEFENFVYELRLKGVELNEILLVTSLIKKIAFSWNEFARMLKQKPKDFSFTDLLIFIRIEGHRNTQKIFPIPGFCVRENIKENIHKPKSNNFKKKNLYDQ